MSSVSRRKLPRRPASHRRVLAIAVAVGCGWVAYTIYGAISAGHALDDRVRELANQNAGLRQQIGERQREISQAQGPAWMEAEARSLGYVRPGEKTYVLASPGAVVPASGGVDVKPLPVYPSPHPGQASPPPALPGEATPTPAPTPTTFTLPPPPAR